MDRYSPWGFVVFALLASGGSWAGTSPVKGDIKTDHFGYRPGDTKIACFTADPGKQVEVRDARTNTLVFSTGTITDKGTDASTPPMSGDHVWWVDFSGLTRPGTYRLHSPSLAESSYDFRVSDSVYQGPMTASLKCLYYQRCGTPKTKASGGVWNDPIPCHLTDAACTAFCSGAPPYGDMHYGTLDLSGGWHDAGDYEKKIGAGKACGVEETGDNGDALWYLLTAYELNPGLFPPHQLDLPESGGNLPDLLNQAKWELDWYLKMQRPDGHVLEGVHVANLGTLASPPSADTTARGYMPPCYESEAVFVAACAHAARVFASLPGSAAYAGTLKRAALRTWNAWVLKSPDLDPQAYSWMPYKSFKLWAASEVFRMDPSQGAARDYIDHSTDWDSAQGQPPPGYVGWAYFNYLQSPGATVSVTQAMGHALGRFADDLFAHDDLYRSGMVDWMYSWGSNQHKADAAFELYLAGRLGTTGSHTPAQCLSHAEDFLHYFHGLNPLNMVYLTNTESMGAKHCLWHVFLVWFGSYSNPECRSKFIGKPASVADPLYPYVPTDNETSIDGPPPGYMPCGPTYQYFQLGGKDVPPNDPGPVQAPYAKAYRDYNQGSQPWIVNEAGISTAAVYMALASVFSGPTPAGIAPIPGKKP
ncbi:MAG TPA: glycoside hydrolase family 9 protein [bacterium]|nr:glycoside hydrolase family 9 protein [bacterium]